ncbi:hypothetical protein TNCV_176891 [Trichonephila clavipes]|nr:hypothetical protein TNCV_176891 [Trichonephila clavipes]
MKEANAIQHYIAAKCSGSVREIGIEEITWTTSHTWKNDRKAGGRGVSVTNVAAKFGINKECRFRALGKRSKPHGTAGRKVGGWPPEDADNRRG